MDKIVINREYLRQVIDENSSNVREFAEKIGVNYTTVYRVLSGDRGPGSKFIASLINSGLDIDLRQIFLS